MEPPKFNPKFLQGKQDKPKANNRFAKRPFQPPATCLLTPASIPTFCLLPPNSCLSFMTKQQIATRVATIVPAAAITAKRAVTFDEAQAGANAVIMGIADENIAANTAGRVILGETAIAESGATIDGTESRLMTDASGRLIPWTTGNNIAARLKKGQTATASGQFVEVYIVAR